MTSPTAAPGWHRDGWLLGGLLSAALALKVWLVWQSTLFARDGVGFIEIAQCLGEQPWAEVIRQSHQHPLYPINIWLTARVYEACSAEALANLDWQNCAHLANCWASLLAVVPMYFLGRRLGGRWVGFAGTLLFLLLPMPAGVLADTLSEGTYLLCLLLAAWAALLGFETRRLPWFGVAGLFGGLAFLARPEGAMVAVSVGTLLLAARAMGHFSWRLTVFGGTWVLILTLMVVGPYWLANGGIGKKTTFKEMLRISSVEEALSPSTAKAAVPLLLASRFQPGTDGQDWHHLTLVFLSREVLEEISRGFHYLALVPAVAGLVLACRRRGLRSSWACLLVLGMAGLNLLLLYWLAWKARYVSERHTLFIVLVGCWCAALAVQTGAAWCAVRWSVLRGRARLLAALALLGLVTASLHRATQPAHVQRLAHYEAGQWLRGQLRPGDEVIDPYGYVAFFAEQRTIYKRKLPRSPENLTYLVFEPGETDRHRLRVASKVRDRGELLRGWPRTGKPRVVIYASKEPSGPPSLMSAQGNGTAR